MCKQNLVSRCITCPPFRDGASFDLDSERLEQRYKELQRRLHPDRFTIHSELEREYSDQQAALVNQAYDVLKRPLRRAHYIVSLSLHPSPEAAHPCGCCLLASIVPTSWPWLGRDSWVRTEELVPD